MLLLSGYSKLSTKIWWRADAPCASMVHGHGTRIETIVTSPCKSRVSMSIGIGGRVVLSMRCTWALWKSNAPANHAHLAYQGACKWRGSCSLQKWCPLEYTSGCQELMQTQASSMDGRKLVESWQDVIGHHEYVVWWVVNLDIVDQCWALGKFQPICNGETWLGAWSWYLGCWELHC